MSQLLKCRDGVLHLMRGAGVPASLLVEQVATIEIPVIFLSEDDLLSHRYEPFQKALVRLGAQGQVVGRPHERGTGVLSGYLVNRSANVRRIARGARRLGLTGSSDTWTL